jgi:hypothetical protein
VVIQVKPQIFTYICYDFPIPNIIIFLLIIIKTMTSFLDIMYNRKNDNEESSLTGNIPEEEFDTESFSLLEYPNDNSTKTMKKKTIHPLSTLPDDVPRELLVPKYCKLLELFYQYKTEVEGLRVENQKVIKENQELKKQLESYKILSDTKTFPLDKSSLIESVNIDFHKHISDNNLTPDYLPHRGHKPFEENESDTVSIPKKDLIILKNIKASYQLQVEEKENKKVLRQIRRQQKAVKNAKYIESLSHNKLNINDINTWLFTPIPSIGQILKQRLLGYLSKNHINSIDELKGKIYRLGEKRLKQLETIFYCGFPPLLNDDDDNNLPYEQEEELNLPL